MREAVRFQGLSSTERAGSRIVSVVITSVPVRTGAGAVDAARMIDVELMVFRSGFAT
jgi:hypothetical protein